jgi:ATP-dependent exoDNAse (exonuclease V) alpha subunit
MAVKFSAKELFMFQLSMTPTLQKAFDILERGTDHVFITGKAGTGKSTLLMKYRQKIQQLGGDLVVLAPTGVAALNVEGQTIHSFFGFAPNISSEEVAVEARRRRNKELYRALVEIVIDEISMVRSDLLDFIDVFLQTVRQSPLPFGGVRMIFFGDLYQLPPVVTNHERAEFAQLYKTPFFFGSKVMQRIQQESLFEGLQVIELDHIFRQQDSRFIDILNAVRTQTATRDHLDHLNSRVNADIDFSQAIILTGRRDSADRLNQIHLSDLESMGQEYLGTISGKFSRGYLPTQEKLVLKAGARVMFVANDPHKRWVNGTLGTVIKTSSSEVMVRIDNGELETVSPYTWELSKMVFNSLTGQLERETLGSFKQLPITVAHAVTIHKAQGKTFDYSVVDLSHGAFAYGQTYVALSRSTSLEGLSLTSPILERHILMDPTIVTFMRDYAL